MPKSVLTLDSRNRINVGSPNNCQFVLQQTVMASKFELSNFQFANQLYNIQTGSNQLYIGGLLAFTQAPGFYDNATFVSGLNVTLKAFLVLVPDVVVLNTTNNQLTWALGANVITKANSSILRVLGLLGGETGSFTSTLFLVGCLQLAVQSPTLSCFSYNTNGSTAAVLGIVPVNVGYMEVEFYEPDRDWQLEFKPRISFNLLNIIINDNRTGLLAEGLGEWACVFIVSDSVDSN